VRVGLHPISGALRLLRPYTADADTVEARTGDYSRWRAALISGAQIISTDYYVPESRFGTGYVIKLPGDRPGRWNILLLPNERPLPPLEPASRNGSY
jgi:hypothetical protein